MILLITAKRTTGLIYHRQIVPFRYLGLPYEVSETEDDLTDDFLKRFSCVSLLRESKQIDRYKALGLIVHFDIDDYWVLPSYHTMYKQYKLMRYAEQTMLCLKQADFVTTTNESLAKKIRPHNPNVFICPNAIDLTEEQWKPQPVEVSHNRLRFGYIAGAHHQKDAEMIHPEIVKLYRDQSIKGKWQVLTGGYNFTALPNGEVRSNVYYKYIEKLFTGAFYNGKHSPLIRAQLNELLDRERLCEFRDMDDDYMRLNGTDVSQYGTLYDSIDVSLVPLMDSMFGACKSNLKMLEAGAKGKACLVSNVLPYSDDFTDDNVLACEPKDWHKNIKYLVNNPNKVKDLAEALVEYTREHYDVAKIGNERKQIFEKWVS